MTHFDIQVVSDTVCPWCYVGKNRLDLAIAQHKAQNPSDTFSTTWHPFYLNPDAPIPGVDKQAHYEQKFGAQRTQMMQIHLARLGQQVGINFGFGGKTGNTKDSHRLIALAYKKGGEKQQTRMVEELFNSYFEVNEDITDRSVLIARAKKVGLDESEIKAYLESGAGGDEVDREVMDAKKKFVSGVPNFTIQGRYEVQGAEEPSAFLGIFDKIRSSGGGGGMANGVEGSGQTC